MGGEIFCGGVMQGSDPRVGGWIGNYADTFSIFCPTAEQILMELGMDQVLNVLYQVCIFSGRCTQVF